MENDITLSVLDAISDAGDGADNTVANIKNKAKIYSERLNKDREKIKEQEHAAVLKDLSGILGVELKEINAETIKGIIDSKISDSDTVKNANKIIEETNAAKLQQVIDNNLAKISAHNPQISTLEDLAKHEKYSEIDAKVKKGYDLYDAFVTTVGVTSKPSTEVINDTRNNNVSYVHPETITQETLAFYRKAFPGKSDDDIIKMYKRDK